VAATSSIMEQIDRMATLEARIKELESTVTALRVEQLHAKSNAVIIEVAASDDKSAPQRLSYSTIDQMVTAAIEQRIGTSDQIDAIFAETVQEQMTSFEVRKAQEEVLEKERKQTAAKERRAEWEERRKVEREKQETSRFETYTTALNIDKEQYDTLKTLEDSTWKTTWETMSTMRKDGGYTPKNYTEAMTHIKTQHSESVKEVLDENQFKTYKEQYMDPMSQQGGFRGFGGSSRHRR
jgi:hypothetical protein